MLPKPGSRLSSVTVGAPKFTLRYFEQDSLPTETAAHHGRDIKRLSSSNVVKL